MITIHRFDLGPICKGHLVIAANFLVSVWWSLYTCMTVYNISDILGPVYKGHLVIAATFLIFPSVVTIQRFYVLYVI